MPLWKVMTVCLGGDEDCWTISHGRGPTLRQRFCSEASANAWIEHEQKDDEETGREPDELYALQCDGPEPDDNYELQPEYPDTQ